MDKAAKVVKRSSARLLGGSQGALSVCSIEMKDVISKAKSFVASQTSVTEFQMKWAADGENRALLDVTNQVWELNAAWTHVQKQFIEELKEYEQLYTRLIEDGRQVDLASVAADSANERAAKLEKQVQKSIKKGSIENTQHLREKQADYQQNSRVAEIEASGKFQENEAVKLIRFKKALTQLSEAYVTLGEQCQLVFTAQRQLAELLPEVTDQPLGKLTYSGAIRAREIVKEVKDKLGISHSRSQSLSPQKSTQPRCEQHNTPPSESRPHGTLTSRNSFQGTYSPQERQRDSWGKSPTERVRRMCSMGDLLPHRRSVGASSAGPGNSPQASDQASYSNKGGEGFWHQTHDIREPPPPYTPSPRCSEISPEVFNSPLSPNITERRGARNHSHFRSPPPPFNPEFNALQQPENTYPSKPSRVDGNHCLEPAVEARSDPQVVAPPYAGLYPRLTDYFPDLTDGIIVPSQAGKCCAMEKDPNEKENEPDPQRNVQNTERKTTFV